MKLSENNFFSNKLTIEHEGEVKRVTVYAYQSYNALYDVMDDDGTLYYRKNYGPWTKTPLFPIQKAIVKHFNLEGEQ